MLSRLSRAMIVALPVIGLLLCSSVALGLGIGVAPGKMEFSLQPGDTEAQTLHVINHADQESEFHVYVEGVSEEWLVITPGEFVLNAQETKSVEIMAAPPLTTKPEGYDFLVCVVSIPPNSELSIGAGVKVPVTVTVNGKTVVTGQVAESPISTEPSGEGIPVSLILFATGGAIIVLVCGILIIRKRVLNGW
jgi:P pilus assembly chaperone PapD